METGFKVLLIDDESELVDTLKDMLELKGYEVSAALDGVTALEKARAHKPNLILLDLTLPRMDGYQVLKALKADENCREIPVLVMTAREDVHDLSSTLDFGAVSYYVKPLKFDTLLALIQTLLGGPGQAVRQSA